MRKHLAFIFILGLGLGILGGCPETEARKKNATKKSYSTTNNATPSKTIQLFYTFNNYGRHEVYLTLYPSGTAQQVCYTTYNIYEGKKQTGNDYGTWRRDFKIIGDGNKQYYYTIDIGGDTYYYYKGWNRLYWNYMDFKTQSSSHYYSVTETEK